MRKCVICNEGIDVIRSAAERGVMVEVGHILTSTLYDTSTSSLVMQRGGFWNGRTSAQVTGVKAGSDNALTVAVRFPAADGQSLKSWAICVRASDRATWAKLWVCSDPNSAIRLNGTISETVTMALNVPSAVLADMGSVASVEALASDVADLAGGALTDAVMDGTTLKLSNADGSRTIELDLA